MPPNHTAVAALTCSEQQQQQPAHVEIESKRVAARLFLSDLHRTSPEQAAKTAAREVPGAPGAAAADPDVRRIRLSRPDRRRAAAGRSDADSAGVAVWGQN